MTYPQFDLVICVGPNDNDIVEHMLNFNKKNIIGYRNNYKKRPAIAYLVHRLLPFHI